MSSLGKHGKLERTGTDAALPDAVAIIGTRVTGPNKSLGIESNRPNALGLQKAKSQTPLPSFYLGSLMCETIGDCPMM